MIWGTKNNERIKATPQGRATCDLCNGELIAKCGEIKIWHWAHKSKIECDDWYEPESEWHINWKNEFPKEQQEVFIKKCVSDYCNNPKYHAPCDHINCVDCEFIKHRADIKNSVGVVIELQNTSIPSRELEQREEFYDSMIWLLNGKKLASGLELRRKENIITFRWKHPPKSWWIANKRIFIDMNQNTYFAPFLTIEQLHNLIFEVRKIYKKCPCGGWGRLITKEQFLKEVCRNGESE